MQKNNQELPAFGVWKNGPHRPRATVQYATEGLSQNLFVSKYRLQLPSEEDIKQYLLENISEEKFKELKEEEENEK